MPRLTRLTHTEAFRSVYRRGRWAKGSALSVGALGNGEKATRVGLRTRRGLKGAVIRNRLKRQLRSIVGTYNAVFRPGLDLVIVIHPKRPSIATSQLEQELRFLCGRLGVILQKEA